MSNFCTLWREESEHSSHSPPAKFGARLWNIWAMFSFRHTGQNVFSFKKTTNTQGWCVRVCICETFPTLSSHSLPLLRTCQNKRLAVLFLHTHPGRHTHVCFYPLFFLFCHPSSFSFIHPSRSEWPRATSATYGNLGGQHQLLLSAFVIFSSIV